MNHTLNDYLPFVEKNHLSSTAHPLQKDIVELCKQINRTTGEIIIAAGGWNEYGEFIDGNQKGIGIEIIKKHKLFETVNDFKRNVEVKYGNQEDIKDIVEELNADLYLITDNWTQEKLKNYSVIKICADLTLVQDRLILTEIKLHEKKNCKTTGA
ncbi:hypothetical protein Q0590_36750 [Rhodocytophaga aerolata]|uniref:Uncharacterized protein n=1 Tax=Rhodocytophaga aerolata TaxID=455078 RepID=A0ABT8RIE0_9BACT|nr:hypothetical protein [Rhodocytophaga aerolata]MDO1451877.1 hypothetical protein [Rhodocytophaga aerolata]